MAHTRNALKLACHLCIFCVVGALFAAPTKGAEDDAQLWATVALTGEIKGPVSAGLLVQPRFADDIDELERVLIQPSVTLALSEWAKLSVGYDAHFITFPRSSKEHRVWQQLGIDTPVSSLSLHHRALLETRFLDDVSGAAVRLRYRLRAAHPLGSTGVEAVLSNEVFFDLNSRRRGPRSGFGENRAFAGVGYRLSETATVEGGYQLQYVDRPGRDAANHVVMIGFSAALR